MKIIQCMGRVIWVDEECLEYDLKKEFWVTPENINISRSYPKFF